MGGMICTANADDRQRENAVAKRYKVEMTVILERGVRKTGWRVIDTKTGKPAKGTKGEHSRPGGYLRREDAVAVANQLNAPLD